MNDLNEMIEDKINNYLDTRMQSLTKQVILEYYKKETSTVLLPLMKEALTDLLERSVVIPMILERHFKDLVQAEFKKKITISVSATPNENA